VLVNNAGLGMWAEFEKTGDLTIFERIMTFRGKAGLWLKLISPGLVDRIAGKAIRHGW
jgi:hypothetical protein